MTVRAREFWIGIDDIIELLEFVLTTTCFIFRNQIYRQRFGTAMDCPVSPMAANIYTWNSLNKCLLRLSTPLEYN